MRVRNIPHKIANTSEINCTCRAEDDDDMLNINIYLHFMYSTYLTGLNKENVIDIVKIPTPSRQVNIKMKIKFEIYDDLIKHTLSQTRPSFHY